MKVLMIMTTDERSGTTTVLVDGRVVATVTSKLTLAGLQISSRMSEKAENFREWTIPENGHQYMEGEL